jgi:hypothetical protein
MFDSTPPNLPVGQVPKPAVAPPGMINQTGIKEPEDIFADIGDPELQASIGVPMTSAKAPVSRGFPWKIILGIGIPVAIIGLGYGAWSVYSTYRSATKPVQMPAAKTTQQPSVPVTAIPDNAPPPANPIAPPDEAKMAGTQAAIALMQAQAAKSDLQGEFATSNAPVMDTSTQALMEKLSATTTPPVAPPNIPAPQIAQTGGNAALKPAIDTDGDGLTNSEEAVLGTDPTKLDSDGDGFPDGSEVKGGYDPSAPKLKLMDSKYLKFETLGAMEFLIPKTWERKAGMGGTIQILTGTPAAINVSMEPFATRQSLLDYVVSQQTGSTPTDFSADKTVSSADVVYSKDGLTAWVLLGNTVYQFRYSTNGAESLDFVTIFKEIIIRQARAPKP